MRKLKKLTSYLLKGSERQLNRNRDQKFKQSPFDGRLLKFLLIERVSEVCVSHFYMFSYKKLSLCELSHNQNSFERRLLQLSLHGRERIIE